MRVCPRVDPCGRGKFTTVARFAEVGGVWFDLDEPINMTEPANLLSGRDDSIQSQILPREEQYGGKTVL